MKDVVLWIMILAVGAAGGYSFSKVVEVTTPDWAIKERFDMEDRKADCHELLREIWIQAANGKFYCVKEIR